MADESTVKCVDCGFLALRRGQEGNLMEADESYRHLFYDSLHGQPWCFMRKRQIYSEYVVDKAKLAAAKAIGAKIGHDIYDDHQKEILQKVASQQNFNEDAAIIDLVLGTPIQCNEFTIY